MLNTSNTNSSMLDDRVKSVITVAVIFYLCTRVFNIRVGHILALLLSVIILYKIQNDQTNETMDFNTMMEFQLQAIGNPSHFHYDTDIVRLFYNLLPWRKLNPNNYDTAIEAINSVLKL